MKLKKLTFTYLYTYLAIGGVGLAFFPAAVLKLFLSTGDYGDIMPRVAGAFMCALSFLIYHMVKYDDWKYYLPSIYVRSFLVVFMSWLYWQSYDPLFLILILIVSIGLVPSILVYYKEKP